MASRTLIDPVESGSEGVSTSQNELSGKITMQMVKVMIDERDELDRYLQQQYNVLDANKINMTAPLVDAEGYPLSTIDIYAVRTARVNIIRTNNDRQALTDRIERALHLLHAQSPPQEGVTRMDVDRHVPQPIAIVDEVTPNSPAHLAVCLFSISILYMQDLRLRDRIIYFGTLDANNFTNMSQIGDIVKHSANTAINVSVLRDARVIQLSLTPKQWSGTGLLGCHIRPITK